MPDILGLEELEKKLGEYDCASGEALDYVRTHYKRYCETLGLITKRGNFRLLELGASYPYAFTLMLRAKFPQADIVLGQYEGVKSERMVTLINARTGETLSLESKSFNIETDRWPFEDNKFDTVLFMEILEHLFLDPCFVFREAHRILRPGGEFMVTTPNIASYESLYKLIHLQTPYRYGPYSRHGAYGRHNREYVPMEVKQIGESSSFATALLATQDVYEHTLDSSALQNMLIGDLNDKQMRGQNIFYIGIKEERPFLPYPQDLFDYDPDTYAAKIEIKELSSCMMHDEPIRGRVKLHNLGHYTWQNNGEDITRLGVQLLDKQGKLLDLDFRRVDLIKNLQPGESTEIDFAIFGVSIPGEHILRFDMVREHMCWFSDVNRNYVDKQISIR